MTRLRAHPRCSVVGSYPPFRALGDLEPGDCRTIITHWKEEKQVALDLASMLSGLLCQPSPR